MTSTRLVRMMVAVFLLLCKIVTSKSQYTCTKEQNKCSPEIRFFVTPEHSLKSGPIRINVTCSARTTCYRGIDYHKIWVKRIGYPGRIIAPPVCYCSDPLKCGNHGRRSLECNQTVSLTSATFGGNSSVQVFCLSQPPSFYCTLRSKNITLLDYMPTSKPTTKPTSKPTTKQTSQKVEVEAQTMDQNAFSPIEITGLAFGCVALFVCVVTCFVVGRIRRRWREGRAEEPGFEALPPVNPYPPPEEERKENIQPTFDIGSDMTLDIEKPHTILGAGAFGVVVLGKLTNYNNGDEYTTYVAVKMLKDFDNPKHKSDFQKEVENLKHLDHPNIVKLIETYSDPFRFYIIMEYIHRGSLSGLLRDEKTKYFTHQSEIRLQHLYQFACNIACGMEYLVSQKRIHRDLAARNILVSDDYTCKISDFGLARNIEALGHYIPTQGYYLPLKWVALEALETKRFTVETDVWSYGIVLWEIFTLGDEPYEYVVQAQEFIELLKEGHRLGKPAACPQEAFDMMQRCWSDEPTNRPNFKELKAWAEDLATGAMGV